MIFVFVDTALHGIVSGLLVIIVLGSSWGKNNLQIFFKDVSETRRPAHLCICVLWIHLEKFDKVERIDIVF